MEAWIMQHVVGFVGVASIIAAAAGYVAKNGLSFVEKEVAELDEELLADIKNPALRQFCVDVEVAAVKAVPDAGDAKYAAITDLFIKDVPQAAPVRPVILATLIAIGGGVKAGVSDATKAPSAP